MAKQSRLADSNVESIVGGSTVDGSIVDGSIVDGGIIGGDANIYLPYQANLSWWREAQRRLSEPFAVEEHNWRIIATTPNGAWVAYYVDVRSMMERLQEVFGHRFTFRMQPVSEYEGANVKAQLTIFIGEDASEVQTVEDFGYAPPTAGEPLKAAATDALRRVMTHLGMCRYLYRLPRVFIRGQNTGKDVKLDADPLDVLKELLNSPTNERVVFYPKRGAHSNETEINIPDEWKHLVGDDPIGYFRREFGAKNSTDKQIVAFMRNTKPTPSLLTMLKDTAHPDGVIKQLLDEKLGKQRT